MNRRSRAANARPRAKKPNGETVARRLCQEILTGQGVAVADVGLTYADDATLRTLNSRYRDMDKATDVLSFTYEDGADDNGHRVIAGDVVLSVPRLRAQAKRYKVSYGRELARLLTHGFLHLCGHDHKKVAERKRMRDLEKEHLDSLSDDDEKALTRLVESWTGGDE